MYAPTSTRRFVRCRLLPDVQAVRRDPAQAEAFGPHVEHLTDADIIKHEKATEREARYAIERGQPCDGVIGG